MAGLKADVSRGLATVSGAAYAAAGNVALIVELERVENRMEAACSTLKVGTYSSQQDWDSWHRGLGLLWVLLSLWV